MSSRNSPQSRRSQGPVSARRMYRSLADKLKGGDSSFAAGETDIPKHYSKSSDAYKTLWEAVEKEDTVAVQSLLSRSHTSSGGGGVWERRGEKKSKEWERDRNKGLNRVSEQGLVPLDVAALTHNSPLLHVLAKAGARHNPVLCGPEEWAKKLDALVKLASLRIQEKKKELLRKGPGLGPQWRADIHRHIHLWSLRWQLYCRMRENFINTDLPGPPGSVSIVVTSSSSLHVAIKEPDGNTFGLVTRYRVEWSTAPSFKHILGSEHVTEMKTATFNITHLTVGVPYFVRVSAYNVKGWGPPQYSTPVSAAPSSWRECIGVKSQIRGHEGLVKKLLKDVKEPYCSALCIDASKPQISIKTLSMSLGIKQLFQSASKFVRLLQRGVYLATVFYHKENILVTAEGQLPLVEIQCCSTSISQDFLWFAKLSCAWQQVPSLLQALSSARSSPSSLLQNRRNILRAVSLLQASLGTVDLGLVNYEILKDRQGNVLLVTLKEFPTSPSPPEPSLQWMSLTRLEKNNSRTLLPEPTAMDNLIEQLKAKLSFHRRCSQWAQPGLYVGILKLFSSVDQIRVLVPQMLPNLLCHARVRHNAHVTREEWAWLQSRGLTTVSCSIQNLLGGDDGHMKESSGVMDFVRPLREAVTYLLTKLNIPLYRAYRYGVYTRELLQFGDKLSMLLLLPPSEDFSSSYWPLLGMKECCLAMPLQIFELVHFWAYDRDFLSKYCQAWVNLELDSHLAQQAVREALETKEVKAATERMDYVTGLLRPLDVIWRDARWIMDCLQCVRSRQWVGAVPLSLVMGGEPPPSPEGAREEDSGITRLITPHPKVEQSTDAESVIRGTPQNGVATNMTTPAGLMVVQEQQAAMVLIEGVAKLGDSDDITPQCTMDLISIGQSEVAFSHALTESGLEHSAGAGQMEAGYTALDEEGILNARHDISACISEIIQPMEMAELADILPSLSLTDEEIPRGPSESVVINVLESFGMGICDSTALSSDMVNGTESLSYLDLNSTDSNTIL